MESVIALTPDVSAELHRLALLMSDFSGVCVFLLGEALCWFLQQDKPDWMVCDLGMLCHPQKWFTSEKG